RREDKAPWWEYYRLRELSDEELLDETAALAGLEFAERLPAAGKTPVDRYRFPSQETSIRKGRKLQLPGSERREVGEVLDIDLRGLTVDIKKRPGYAEFHPISVFEHDVVPATAQPESLMRLGEWVAANGVDIPGPYRAARDLLLRHPPRLVGHEGGGLMAPEENGVQAARRLALMLDRGALAIQGPPGSGKTFTGARMILDLVRNGKKVGVCAASHKVVRNLLSAGGSAAEEGGGEITRLARAREAEAGPRSA